VRSAPLAIVLVAACGKGKSESGSSVATPTVAAEAAAPAPPDPVAFTGDLKVICETEKRLMERAIKCAPRSADKLKSVQEATAFGFAAGGLDHAPRSAVERWASLCALTAKAYDEQLAGTDCRLTDEERVRNEAFLAAYFGRRTKPRATGDATIDKNLAELAAARDALCACTDEDCVRAARKVVTDAIEPLPREMPDATEDGVAISDEVSRCAERIENDVARARR
jgi:hypothetical protein